MKSDVFMNSFCRLLHSLAGCSCLVCQKTLSMRNPFFICQNCLRELRNEVVGVRFALEGLPVRSIFEYRGAARQLMRQAKFENCRLSALLLSEITAATVPGRFGTLHGGQPFEQCDRHGLDPVQALVPVPCSRKSLRRRGWDPVEIAACRITEKAGCPVVKAVGLNRFRKRQGQQKTLGRKERLESTADRFRLLPDQNSLSKLNRVLVLDDVMTTGSTISSAASLIAGENHSLSVEGLVICCD